ncbi:hypothetical protein LR007_04515, partial [candidate division NPL-UPA2 bacterium]|nr:hypothetical protein [candidate division NPL-UPA2 bacterium]
IKLYATGISDEEITKCHAQPIHSVEEGIEEGIREYGSDATIGIIPDGPYVLAGLKDKKQFHALRLRKP